MTFWSDVLGLLNETGWAKGIEKMNMEKKHCLASALGQVVRERYAPSYGQFGIVFSREKMRELESFLDISHGEIPAWNDAVERTFSDIESVLKTLHERELEREEV